MIRTAVRPDVWTLLRKKDEALDKVEEHVRDLQWDESETLAILAERIRSYCHEKGLLRERLSSLTHQELIQLLFAPRFPWGLRRETIRPPHVVIHTVSFGKPRWALQLCKAAAKSAVKRSRNVITIEDIDDSMPAYGAQRITDIVAEHNYECPEVSELMTAFSGGAAQYTTAELMVAIRNRILSHLTPRIDGRAANSARDIAEFLYRIGFLAARYDDKVDGGYHHYWFEERPWLLEDRGNIDQGMSWEIHPFVRGGLGLKGGK